MDSGYWKEVAEEEARKRLAFFTPDRKWRCKVMPMGDLNAAPIFVAIMMTLHMERDTLSKEHGLKNVASKIIVDYMLLYGRTAKQLLDHFRTILEVLKHHRATLKLKRCKWFQDRCESVGMDMEAGGTQPAQSKHEDFSKLERPNTRREPRILIGVFEFQSQLQTFYDLDIIPWRYIL